MMHAAVTAVMDGECGEAEVAALLTALAVAGESADDVAGAAMAMREHAAVIPTSRRGLIDTCGTGGDRLHTFNISTAAALVVAAAGVPVAKHGNRGVSSSSGSADVLEALGVDIGLSPRQVGRCIDAIGIGFCFARVMHTAMKHVAPVRSTLGFRTIFNLLGPLTNPAGAEFQLIGANRVATAEKLAKAIAQLGTGRTLVVCGADELDEVSLWGETTVFDVSGGDVRRFTWTPADFGCAESTVDAIQVEGPGESAQVIRDVLSGGKGPAADIVKVNAAAALIAAGRSETTSAAAQVAEEVIASGAAERLLDDLAAWTQEATEAE
ncbi:MAG: anthranilate phosphoribosyltransferase [Planctomycetota bacterium]|nr:MAG: anthranilate phosphoribosyltransferase [Planctomycetota bacterium]REJ90844.1 MAG: anthranilate phosphoribosyltransferase [Planctomycetota bacterium]REK24545.1 MAG: anthranilate phosphoribosyltransferase [Planctomycetota bacterium]REK28842.1 MAG: anthranilate phosphoribosyltransferase [Planctomycetota bacterium]